MIDFLAIAASTPNYNFHSHTQFCDGRYSMADFAAAAARSGFVHWGFTPHSPVPIASPCNMLKSDVKAYLDEFRKLKDEYAGRLSLYAGMEVDYLGADWGPSNPYFTALPLDYMIGSVHFIPSQKGELVDIDGSYKNFRVKMERYFDGDIRYVVNTFYDRSMDMIRAGGFDIIGHFDKIGHNAAHYCAGIENEPWYAERVNQLIDAIISSGVTVEINTKSREGHGRFFPHIRYWQRLVDARVPVIFNSDAHHIDLINASRPEAMELFAAL